MDAYGYAQAFLREEFLGNPWERWGLALGVFALLFFLSWAAKSFLVARLRKLAPATPSPWDDLALLLLEKTQPFFLLLVAVHFAVASLALHPKVDAATHYTFMLVLFLQLGFWANHALTFLGMGYAEKTLSSDPARATTVRALLVLGKIVVWVTVLLLLLDNWGVKVAPFVAGLGIGGVAIALAVQNILGDLLASLSIVLDKPFVIGDTIAVGQETGTVEHIGLKTTRVKSISGEQLIFSNSDLLQSRVRNFKRMAERRAEFTFGLTYATPASKLHRAREIVGEILASTKGARLERCHLHGFGASSLDFQVVYWVDSPDYQYYVERHHQIAVRLVEAFRSEQIEFAYPTQTVHLQGRSHEKPRV